MPISKCKEYGGSFMSWGFFEKKKYEQTFEKNSLCLLEKHLNFLSTQISSFYQNFRKKCFKKCPVLGQRESLRDVPFLETLISSKKCKKKFLTSA